MLNIDRYSTPLKNLWQYKITTKLNSTKYIISNFSTVRRHMVNREITDNKKCNVHYP